MPVRHIFLDSTPLGVLTDPNPGPDALFARTWMADLLLAGHRLWVPEVIRYELRRELLRANKKRSEELLDLLSTRLDYSPITSNAMEKAAELWSGVRQAGKPISGPDDLDADCILAAQLHVSGLPNAVVATGNLKHLSLLAPAELWRNILP